MITVQQQAARLTRRAWEELMRTAEFVPEDKRSWVPQGEARTFHDILAECVLAIDNGTHFRFLQTGQFPPRDPEAYQRARAKLDTLDKIKAVGEPAIERWSAAIEAIPVDRLEESYETPWGMPTTMADMLFGCYWNQMLLGDSEMH